jgi:hypothetical protein
MPSDPTITDPGPYRVICENDRVRVLEYRDRPAGQVRWISAQEHAGENIGTTESHSIFVELKEPPPAGAPAGELPLGPGT